MILIKIIINTNGDSNPSIAKTRTINKIKGAKQIKDTKIDITKYAIPQIISNTPFKNFFIVLNFIRCSQLLYENSKYCKDHLMF